MTEFNPNPNEYPDTMRPIQELLSDELDRLEREGVVVRDDPSSDEFVPAIRELSDDPQRRELEIERAAVLAQLAELQAAFRAQHPVVQEETEGRIGEAHVSRQEQTTDTELDAKMRELTNKLLELDVKIGNWPPA